MVSDTAHQSMLTVARNELGARVTIESLAEMKARGEKRPDCFCLACARRLSARLGLKRRHHFAHRPEAGFERCWATSPEGELHIHAKHLLEIALTEACERAEVLTAKLRCPSCGTRDSFSQDVVQLQTGYRVLVEHWGDPRRVIKPDLQVMDENDEPVLFVEVRVTHESSDGKVRFVRESGVPMLELDGEDVVSQEGTASTFSCVGHQNLRATGACPACMQRSVDEEMRREHEREERDAETKREAARRAREAEVTAAWPEAERRALQRLERERAVDGVARCHLHVFVGPRCVAKKTLVARVSWPGTTTRLALAESGAAKPIQVWTGSSRELQRVYSTEFREAARKHSVALAARFDPGAEVETFGGFKTGHFMVAPLTHLRVPSPDGRGWVTAYPWQVLVDTYGRGTVQPMVQSGTWTTLKTDDGTVVIPARLVDEYLKRSRFEPDLERPSKSSDPRWDAMVVREVRRLVGDAWNA